MRLTPKRPPGRANRKALAFAPEIARLHAEGYSCEAIRQALAEAELTVSRSTVTREVARLATRRQGFATPAAAIAIVTEGSARLALPTSPTSALASDRRSGKEIAAAWVKDHTANPLLRRCS